MTIAYNTKKAEDSQFERFGPGVYACVVANAEEKPSSRGDPMISLKWVFEDEQAVIACFDNLVFNEKGTGIAHKKLKMMGVPLPADGADVDVAIEAADLIGCRATLTLVNKEYQGKTYLQPDFKADDFGYAPGGATGVPEPTKGSIVDRAFDEEIPF